YILAAVIGAALIFGAIFLLCRMLRIPGAADTAERDSGTSSVSAVPLPSGQIPSWLLESGPPGSGGRISSQSRFQSARKNYLQKTISGIAANARETIFAEKWAKQDGLLQRLDPRVKVIGLLGMVGVISFAHRPTVLTALCLFLLLSARLSRLPIGALISKIW